MVKKYLTILTLVFITLTLSISLIGCIKKECPAFQINDDTVTSKVAVFPNGTVEATTIMLERQGIAFDLSWEPTPEKYPVLVVPTGGLYGLRAKQDLISNLHSYIESGGNLIVFSQMLGADYSVLPEGNILAFGYAEDEHARIGSVNINTYHPVFSSQSSSLLDIYVDGHIVSYPENAIVLLSRVENNMPAMIMYEWTDPSNTELTDKSNFQGKIIVTTAVTDWAFVEGTATEEEILLFTNVINWFRDTRPESQKLDPIESIREPVTISNTLPLTSTHTVNIMLKAPNQKIVWEQTSDVRLPPESTKTVNIDYSGPFYPGIWNLEYVIYNCNGDIIDNGFRSFAVGTPILTDVPIDGSKSNLSFSITTPHEKPPWGDDVEFNINVINEGTTDKYVTIVYWDDNEGDKQGWARWYCADCISGEQCEPGCVMETLHVPAHDMASFDYTHYGVSISKGSAFDVYFYDESGKSLGYDIKGIHPIRTITSDRYIAIKEDEIVTDDVVDFGDPNLEMVIREIIEKPSGSIYSFDLNNIIRINADQSNISDLGGLEYCSNLVEFNAYWNSISDLSPLSELANLEVLALGHNQISDLSPLSDLTELTELSLGDNQISDITPLSNLINLTHLSIWQNSIEDVVALSQLANLRVLELDYNRIADIAPLSYLKNLIVLDLRMNDVIDISALSGLVNLAHVELGGNSIADLSPLLNNSGLNHADYIQWTSDRGNPLSEQSRNIFAPLLETRGTLR